MIKWFESEFKTKLNRRRYLGILMLSYGVTALFYKFIRTPPLWYLIFVIFIGIGLILRKVKK